MWLYLAVGKDVVATHVPTVPLALIGAYWTSAKPLAPSGVPPTTYKYPLYATEVWRSLAVGKEVVAVHVPTVPLALIGAYWTSAK